MDFDLQHLVTALKTCANIPITFRTRNELTEFFEKLEDRERQFLAELVCFDEGNHVNPDS